MNLTSVFSKLPCLTYPDQQRRPREEQLEQITVRSQGKQNIKIDLSFCTTLALCYEFSFCMERAVEATENPSSLVLRFPTTTIHSTIFSWNHQISAFDPSKTFYTCDGFCRSGKTKSNQKHGLKLKFDLPYSKIEIKDTLPNCKWYHMV